jgi:delta24-sterol reductase
MGQITAALNPLGWTLAVVPELDDLTVGGLLMGFGVETSSHKYGLFQHICVAYEVVMADGSLVKATAKENPELFYALPWSHGTLGFLVSAEIQIVRCKNFVKVDYYPVQTRKEGLALFEKEGRNTKNDFVEALAFSENDFVIMVGNMVETPEPSKINAIGKYWKPWFYTHVETFLKEGPSTEYIPLRHYYHRHTRSLFWELEDIIPVGNHPIFRYLLGWATPPKVSLLKLFNTQSLQRLYELHHVDQDFLVPMKSLDRTLQTCNQEFGVFPIWLCPMKIFPTPYRGFVNPVEGDDLFVDIGLYGVPKAKSFVAKPSTRNIEKVIREEKGFQALYADTYATYEEFRQMFDHKLYDSLREKYKCAAAFPEVYHKVNKQARA